LTIHDLVIVGGGVNGCGIARDAAGRGLSVLLVEANDLGSGTSQWSTKLVHGGLRYLEHYAFRLVREALIEREVLLRAAPHIVRPLRFVLPHTAGMRPAWLLRLGLFLYDNLGGRKLLPGTTTLDLTSGAFGAPLGHKVRTGFAYSDCSVDDSRLVVLNAIDAAHRGADIRVRTACTSVSMAGGLWQVAIEGPTGPETHQARALIVAAGPWVGRFVEGVVRANTSAPLRLVKGSHIITRRLFEHDHAYILQNNDGRIVFAIPYFSDTTLIGTTDVEYQGDPAAVAIDEGEVDYLLAAVNQHFVKPVTRSDIVRSFSGVRPLYDDGASAAKDATRDYVLDVQRSAGNPPRLTIYGGKITTYRKLAEHALELLAPEFPEARGAWTATSPLPGGAFPVGGHEALAAELLQSFPFLMAAQAARFVDAYGTRSRDLMEGATSPSDMGVRFGADLTGREVAWLIRTEWARTADDIVWRRSKLGLRLSAQEIAAVQSYIDQTSAGVVA
jgi:glycerol-3-phosphate dehydrogenase